MANLHRRMRVPAPVPRPLAIVVAAVAILVGSAALALGGVTVYKNSFGSKSQAKQLEKASGGKRCVRGYRERGGKLKLTAKRGPASCTVRPPLEGDLAMPDHEIRVTGVILKKQTPRAARRGAFLSAAVRVGGGDRYELQVKPKGKRFKLTREPDAAGFPIRGKSRKIGAIGERNTLRLRAYGTKIRAFVNGKQVAVTDETNPGQVAGRKLAVGAGTTSGRNKPVVATLDNVAVQVPRP